MFRKLITTAAAALLITAAACGGNEPQAQPAELATIAPAPPGPAETANIEMPARAEPIQQIEQTAQEHQATQQQPPQRETPKSTQVVVSPGEPTSTPPPEPTPPQMQVPTETPVPTPTSLPASTPLPEATSTSVPASTSIPTDTPYPTNTPTITVTLTPEPPIIDSDLTGYSSLLVEAVSGYQDRPGFVSGSLTSEEKQILDWADSKFFSNPAVLASKYSPNNWPSEVKRDSARAMIEMMKAIDIEKKPNGKHIVNWEKDSLDRIMDELGVYEGMCVRCYDQEGYDTIDGIADNYVPIIRSEEYVHRKTIESLSYFVKADGEGILKRSFMENDADDFELLFKRKIDKYPITIAVGADAYQNVLFMSRIELPDGTSVTYPTMTFEMVGNAKTERQAVENIFDYARKKLTHFSGDLDDFADIYRPYSVTPYSPELGWVLHVGEAGSPSASALLTGAFRAIGLKAEQFQTPRKIINAFSVEVNGETHFGSGNDVMNRKLETGPIDRFFQTLEEVENKQYDY